MLAFSPNVLYNIAEKLEITKEQVNSAVKTLQKKYSEDSGIQLLSFNKKLQFNPG